MTMDVFWVFRFLFGLLLGAMLGSFANVCIYRIPRGESVAFPSSHCPRCQFSIPWYDNIPILSFVFLKGRCAGCRHWISWQYPLVEGISAALCAFVVGPMNPLSFASFLGVVLTFILLVMSGIDFHLKIIPDVLSLGLLGIGWAVAPLNPLLGGTPGERVLWSVVGSVVGFGFLWFLAWGGERFFQKEALGGGDVKLMAGVGGVLGPWGVLATLFLASLLGTVFFFLMKLSRRLNWGAYLPFGPFLAIGAYLYYIAPGVWLRLLGL